MKVEIKSKKGLRTILSIVVDKKTIQNKMDERLNELQKEVSLKGFRAGKVPTSVIKRDKIGKVCLQKLGSDLLVVQSSR